jgi:hypothetical protein
MFDFVYACTFSLKPSSFIPWAVHDQRLAITSASLLRLCTIMSVPVLFVEGLLEYNYWVRPGNGLFFSRDENGNYVKLGLQFPSLVRRPQILMWIVYPDLFYRCPSAGGRAFILTTYDFTKKLTTNLCFNIQPDQALLGAKVGERLTRSSFEDPLAIHILLASQISQSFTREASTLRVHLLQEVCRRGLPNLSRIYIF